MKAIIFDVDGVIIKSAWEKKEIIAKILKKYGLYDIPWVMDILWLGLNRKLILEKIYEIVPFDKISVLQEINDENAILERNAVENKNVVEFIKNNYEKYIFCTNTSLPQASLARVVEALDIWIFFQEFLAFENGSKLENAQYILTKYNLKPQEVLFIDDNIHHIEKVEVTWMHTLHFSNYGIDLQEEIQKIF